MPQKPTPEPLRQQIEGYIKERPDYKVYADALRRVFTDACKRSAVDAEIQARAKTVSSFAEKCARKFEEKPDPVSQFNDLCGARIIVQTLEHVRAVMLFIEANFKIEERDDKTSSLGEDQFGYRDMHYLVRLIPERAKVIGVSDEECSTIGARIAEVQVRSLVQHSWANIIHDRVYKAPLKLSNEAKRTTALLAAIMEDGDRTFERLANELDSMAANYTAYADRDKVKREIDIQELILANEREPEQRAGVALQLARLHAPCGNYERVVELLETVATTPGAAQFEILLELGSALGRLHRDKPQAQEYQSGQRYLEDVIAHCSRKDFTTIPNTRQQTSLLARARSRLAWSWEAIPDGEGRARDHYRAALELEPTNPYHLASQLGFEIYCLRNASLIDSMRTTVRRGIETCREHALAGTELPYAFFTGGRLQLLLGDANEGLGWYARGLRHLFDGKSCVPVDVIEDEVQWIRRIHFGDTAPAKEHGWIERLITLARTLHSQCAVPGAEVVASPVRAQRVLILAGGASSMDVATLDRVRPLMEAALERFDGTVISGGTKVGVPGCAGEIAAKLKSAGQKHFELIGYRPEYLPDDAPRDDRYDHAEVFRGDTGFSPEQILRTWEDLIGDGLRPAQVQLLGFGGGALTAVEYRVALALGATVGVVRLTSDEQLKLAQSPLASINGPALPSDRAEFIACDPFWADAPSLYPLPCDVASVRAFVTSPTQQYDCGKLEEMAMSFHEGFLRDNKRRLPENLRPWPDLPETYRVANRGQAGYAVEILRAAGFDVRETSGAAAGKIEFEHEDIERMAELEHGRWNVERLRNGWRFGKPRDNEKKIHDCLVPWAELPEPIRDYDRRGVCAFPEILAKAGLEIFRE